MDSQYNHKEYEGKIYESWEKSGAFTPNDSKKTFSIIMPPPNANDPLHIGHAMFVTIEDILIRYHRMLGESVLWLPGTDHAGIETQFVFEKKLAKNGQSRFNFDRETLYKMIWEYVEKNSGGAIDQMKKLGASADWSKFKFTLDTDIVKKVLDTFVKLHNDDLIYRGERLVNYCTKCGTGYSELEIEYVERNDPLYYMKYGPFTIATARPETKFRDSALAVNPNDKKYKKYIGQTFEIMGLLGPTQMTIIPDPEVDPKFGTGIMKVTPAHDPHDFELGKQFNLPVIPIITAEGRMDFKWFLEDPKFESFDKKYKARAKVYDRMKVAEARKLMVEHLTEDGLLIKVNETYSHRIGTCYRCHAVLEPIPLPQFFIKTKPLIRGVLKSLDTKETIVLGAGQEKILRHWLNNIRDWNISRQIVWGIRIPVWYSAEENKDLIVTFIDKSGQKKTGKISDFDFDEVQKGLQSVKASSETEFKVSTEKPKGKWLQETDTFDTWFSSGQWPVVTLQTNGNETFEKFYPTSVMETGYDILPIWVMRMMLLGIYQTGKSPFKMVYLHGLVRDDKGRKMSKSIGNVINPLEVVEKYGTDALRFALIMSSTPAHDKSVGENSFRGMRNFSNKIWNAARFVRDFNNEADDDKEFNTWYKNDFPKKVTTLLNKYKIGLAAEELYNDFWHRFCDIEIERAKKNEVSSRQLKEVLNILLKLLHPFVPFVTEAIWKELENDDLLITSKWPGIDNEKGSNQSPQY